MSLVGALAAEPRAHVQNGSLAARLQPPRIRRPAQAHLHALAGHVIHLVLLARVGEPRNDGRPLQVPRLEGERAEPHLLSRRSTARAERLARPSQPGPRRRG